MRVDIKVNMVVLLGANYLGLFQKLKAESQHLATPSKPVIQQVPINFGEGYAQNMTRANDPNAWLQQYYQKHPT